MSTLNAMNFGIRLSAKDETGGPLSSALRGFTNFARTVAAKPITIPLKIGSAGLGLLRDLNLGLRPIVVGMDRMIERGAMLETQFDAFAKFTGKSTRDAETLARHFIDMAHGALRYGEALQIANDAMTTNIPYQSLDRMFQFAARRAAATGASTQGVMAGLIRGLGLGSARALKEFGLDLAHVQEGFDRKHGGGAFDNLDFAARQSLILKAAMVEMRKEGQLLRFTGNETIFTFQRIKNEIGDAVDRLSLGVARSKGLRSALESVRDVLGGITEHFEGGGGFEELLFGKRQGGGSIFGIARGLLADLGEGFGRGFMVVLLKGSAELLGLVDGVLTWAEGKVLAFWGKFEGRILGTLGLVKTKAGELVDAIVDRLPSGLKSLLDLGKSTGDASTESAPGGGRSLSTVQDFKEFGSYLLQTNSTRFLRILEHFFEIETFNRVFRGVEPGQQVDPRSGLPITRGGAGGGPISPSSNPLLTALFGFTTSAVGAGEAMEEGARGLKKLQRRFSELARGLMDTGLFAGDSQFKTQLDRFRRDFAPRKPLDSRRRRELIDEEFDGFGLTRAGLDRVYREKKKLERELRGIEGQADRDARRMAGEEERRLRRDGYNVTPDDRKRMEARFREELIQQRGARQRARLDEIDEILGRHHGPARHTGGSSLSQSGSEGAQQAAEQVASAAREIASDVRLLVATAQQLIGQMAGASAELAKARA